MNRTSGMLYVWPPAGAASPYWQMSPWGEPVVPSQWAPPAADAARRAQVSAAVNAADAPIGEVSVKSDLFVFNGTSVSAAVLEVGTVGAARNAHTVNLLHAVLYSRQRRSHNCT